MIWGGEGGRAAVCWGHEKGEVCYWTVNLRSLQAKGGDATGSLELGQAGGELSQAM